MNDTPPVIFEPLHPDVATPSRATQGAAGYDLRAYLRGRKVDAYRGVTPIVIDVEGDTLVIPAGVRAAIPLGFRASMPFSMEAQLRLRSSIAFRRGLVMPNAPATIDPDYPGEWLVIVTNTLSDPVDVRHQERIAQVVFAGFRSPEFQLGTVGRSSDRAGGLGSTGKFEVDGTP